MTFGNPALSFPSGYGTTAYLKTIYNLAIPLKETAWQEISVCRAAARLRSSGESVTYLSVYHGRHIAQF